MCLECHPLLPNKSPGTLFRPFTSFLLAAINRELAVLAGHCTDKTPGFSTELKNATGLFTKGKSPKGPVLPQPTINNEIIHAGRAGAAQPSPDPKGHRSPKAATEAFLCVLWRGTHFFFNICSVRRQNPSLPSHKTSQFCAGQFLTRQPQAQLKSPRKKTKKKLSFLSLCSISTHQRGLRQPRRRAANTKTSTERGT